MGFGTGVGGGGGGSLLHSPLLMATQTQHLTLFSSHLVPGQASDSGLTLRFFAAD